MPGLVIVGGYCLSLAGWTSQIHHLCEVAGEGACPGPDTIRVTRTAACLGVLRRWIQPDVSGPHGLDVLHPAMALADALIARQEDPEDRTYLAMPDDLDPDGMERSFLPEFRQALMDRGADAAVVDRICSLYLPALDPDHDDAAPLFRR